MIRLDWGHLVINVRNLERSRHFYSGVLGLNLVSELPEHKTAFLASHGRHHPELAIVEVGPEVPLPARGEDGFDHVAFRVRSEQNLRSVREELVNHQVQVSAITPQGTTRRLYFYDPDGHPLEIYCEVPKRPELPLDATMEHKIPATHRVSRDFPHSR